MLCPGAAANFLPLSSAGVKVVNFSCQEENVLLVHIVHFSVVEFCRLWSLWRSNE